MSNIAVERLEGGTLGTRWTPVVGPFTSEFVERKLKQRGAPDPEAMQRVVSEAAVILGRCVPPAEQAGRDAGLVVGYVQSGKTLSFTTLTALARDNGYGAVILLAGTAVTLKGQSEDRLTVDLGLEDIQHDWRQFDNPETKNGDESEMEKVLRNWRPGPAGTPGMVKRRSLLITVLKHHQRLRNLREVLDRVDLRGVPFLIIDDESDQAGLNAKAGKNLREGTDELSTTYRRILELKAVIPHHTYLQYTATPQANLLIAVADVLSPSFAELVSPGDGYVGGRQFFSADKPLCIAIPPQDVPTVQALTEAPLSLQKALQLFLLGAAHHNVTRGKGNRSMMVHPSQRTAPHTDYKEWLDGLIEHWRDFIEQPKGSGVRNELEQGLQESYDELRQTFPALAPIDDLANALPDVFSELKAVKVNSNADGQREVKWNKWPYWILVGGQKLDRGFTVEGLTISYMPRTASSNADTLQQRARFFGYKKSYEGLCRVFLLGDVIDTFASYVESEEFVRDALTEHRGMPLQEWKRDFILNRALSPTRRAVIGRRVVAVDMDEGWVVPGSLYFDGDAVRSNRALFERKASAWKDAYGAVDAGTIPDFKDARRDSPRNILVEGVPIGEVLDFLLAVQIRSVDDSADVAAMAISLVKHRNESGGALADVVLIGNLSTEGLTGRSLTADGKINNLFVGESPKGAASLAELNYVGDRALFTSDRVTLHLRYLKLKPDARVDTSVEDCVPWFSVRLPARVAKDCVIEEL